MSKQKYHINVITDIINVLPKDKHKLSINGPYIDAHFGEINNENPVGQTYYLRPLSHYDKHKRELYMNVNCHSDTIFFNKNEVVSNVKFCGRIYISNVDFNGKHYSTNHNSMFDANLTVHNNTGLELRGLHVHDGILKNNMTIFGPICYFLYNTQYWMDKKDVKNKHRHGYVGPQPLPADNVVPIKDYILKLS